MPTVGKPIFLPNGDFMELLETAAMTNGERVKAKFRFSTTTALAVEHINQRHDERIEVISGRLAYTLAGKRGVATPGETIMLPRNVPHRHYSEDGKPVVFSATITPGLDFDYLLETLFGRGSEGKALEGVGHHIQALVWRRKLQAPFTHPRVPVWFQDALARIITPVAYAFGYRAVYRRFSGEEW